MIIIQAGKDLMKALSFGRIALLIGTSGKGLLYYWLNDNF